MIAVFNAKSALFFFAFLPQLVEPGRGSALLQIQLLGVTYPSMALVTNSGYALVASRLAHWIRRSAVR